MEENKGIYHQVRNPNTVKPSKEFKLSDLKEMLEHLQEAEVKNKKQKEDIKNENSKHLVDRSKKLGKEIPIEVLFMTDPNFNPSLLVSGEFMKKYKEWF
ncbi:MAG: hypothetical protein CMH22_05745 [Methylophaga sp.]|nr:hypothetical protein [Methylophaga sp.]|tara:strand:+ start:93098 stop:93394 length:297 start_codon:yes stop_codon:yes gene_type:complete